MINHCFFPATDALTCIETSILYIEIIFTSTPWSNRYGGGYITPIPIMNCTSNLGQHIAIHLPNHNDVI